MPDVTVVGGGPAGMSAALFTEKNGLPTTVIDAGDSWMTLAHLYNYLGIRSISGDEFLNLARGQVRDRGVTIKTDTEVTSIKNRESGFLVTTASTEFETDYVILATGDDIELAKELDCSVGEDDTVAVDLSMETSVDDVYATGAMIRVAAYEAIISAGDGGAAALDILAKEHGEQFHDFDTPEDVPNLKTPT